jgi:putative tricarboxylic transport membrane protein
MRTDRLTAIVAALIALGYWIATEQIMEPPIGDPIGPKAIPRLLAFGLLLSAVLLWIETRSKHQPKQPLNEASSVSEIAENRERQSRPLFIPTLVAGTSIYLAVFSWAGYPVATAIYLMALMFIFNPGKLLTNIATAIGFSLASYLIFTRFFGTQLPSGALPF